MKFFDSNGKEIPFKEYISEFGGPDLYHNDFHELLKSWRTADWVKTDDFIAPIAAQVIVDACELDRESFEKIMTAIEEAYEKFRPLINPPHITRIK